MTTEYRELIVGYDESERGRDALALGELLVRSIQAPLHVVRFLTAGDRKVDGAAARDEERLIGEELAPQIGELPVQVEVSVTASPSAAKGFEQLAGNRPDRLVVLGSTQRAGLQRVFPGSVAERLLQHGRSAVAIAPRGFARRHERRASEGPPSSAVPLRDELRVIAVGFNGRPESRAALEAAAHLGMRTGATLRVIAIGQPLEREQRLSQPRPKAAEDLQGELAAAVRDLPAELRALPVFDRGNPAPLIWDKAQEGVDLLVIGSAGQGPLLRAWLTDPGTVLMRSAPCPLLLTPPPVA